MPVSTRTLLRHQPHRLRLLSPEHPAIDAPIQWVYSSDLADPTPFLTDGTVLLTTGTQFNGAPQHPDTYEPYVARLRNAGIRSLGFGTEIARHGTPELLVQACERAELPLFEVPYSTPFLAIIRQAGAQIDRLAHARDTWALRAGRAVSLAALKPNGLAATLGELGHQLGAWVALYDAGGGLSEYTAPPGPTLAATVARHLTPLLATGTRSSVSASHRNQHLSLHTLGSSGHLRGVLALCTPHAPDAAEAGLVRNVVALASLALEHEHHSAQSSAPVRDAVYRLLVDPTPVDASAGTHPRRDAAHEVALHLWGALPEEPLHVLAWHAEDAPELPDSGVIAARSDDLRVAVIGAERLSAALRFTAAHGAATGYSLPGTLHDLATLHIQATHCAALARSRGVAEVSFASLHTAPLWSTLNDSLLSALSATLLDRLDTAGEHEPSLRHTLQVWLAQNCANAPAAAALGIHRHTLTARLRLCEQALQRDLSDFGTRAELWVALSAAQHTAHTARTESQPVAATATPSSVTNAPPGSTTDPIGANPSGTQPGGNVASSA